MMLCLPGGWNPLEAPDPRLGIKLKGRNVASI